MMLRRGDKGDLVGQVQLKLVALGYLDEHVRLTGPGIFGPATERAVMEWERDRYVAGVLDDDELGELLIPDRRMVDADHIPNGQAELIELYGRPWDNPRDWQSRWLGRANIGLDFSHAVKPYNVGGRRSCYIRCNVDVVASLEAVFATIAEEKLADEIRSFDGCHNVRVIRDADAFDAQALNIKGLDALPWSTHTWAVSIDINAATNRMGTEGDMHPSIVRIFKEHGWFCGADFTRSDPMHFQRVTGM